MTELSLSEVVFLLFLGYPAILAKAAPTVPTAHRAYKLPSGRPMNCTLNDEVGIGRLIKIELFRNDASTPLGALVISMSVVLAKR